MLKTKYCVKIVVRQGEAIAHEEYYSDSGGNVRRFEKLTTACYMAGCAISGFAKTWMYEMDQITVQVLDDLDQVIETFNW